MANIAVFVARKLEGFFAAERRLLERYAQLIAQIVALLRRVPALRRAAHAAAKEQVKDIAHTAHTAHAAKAAEVKAACAARAAKAAHVRAVMAVAVILRALLRVRQHLVGLVELLKARLSLLIVGVQVGVAFLGLGAVGLLNILGAGVLINAQHLIIITFCCHDNL